MSLKAKLEAIIYAAETPITLDHIVQLVKDSVVAEAAAKSAPIRQPMWTSNRACAPRWKS